MHPKEKSAAAKLIASDLTSPTYKRMLFSHGDMPVTGKKTGLYADLRERLKKVIIDDEELYIAEGDTLLDEAQLEIYALQKEAVNQVREFEKLSDAAGLGKLLLSDGYHRGLIGITQGGKIVRWEPGLTLTYCVLKRTFSSNQHYGMVRNNFLQAAQDWEAACGIRFEYREGLDDSASTDPAGIGVVFVVRELNANGSFIAAAFFPNDPVYRRRVLIDPSYYGAGRFDKVGVLRHELGHVLGFRHEHPRADAPADCHGEELGQQTTELTPYDSRSVMHYLCGGAGDPALRITDLDRAGAQKIYGPPLHTIMTLR